MAKPPPKHSDANRAPAATPAAPKKSLRRDLLLGIIALAAAFWLLRETFTVTMPLLAALLLALAVWPLVDAIRKRMPRRLEWLGAVAGLLIVLVVLGVFLAGLGLAVEQLYRLGSDLEPRLRERVDGLPLPDILSDGPNGDGQSLTSVQGLASQAMAALGVTAHVAGGIVAILFLMLLMLTESHNWYRKTLTLTEPGGEQRWLEIGRSVGQKFRAFFTTRFIIGLISAVLYVGWLAIFGVDYLLLWGILTILLSFIPTVGSIISGTLPVLYVFVLRDPVSAAIVGAGLLVIEQVIGNFVDPKVMGRRLAVSPLVVLVSLLFWSLLWGIPGALLAVPLTVLATLVMAHFEGLKPAALLLTDCGTFEELDRYRDPG